jgi:hypothetical protein
MRKVRSALSTIGRRCAFFACRLVEVCIGKYVLIAQRALADPRKRLSPAAGRNKQPILEVLQAHLPAASAGGAEASLDVLEVASGTGEHAAHFVSNLPVSSWQPTEYTGCASPLMAEQKLEEIFESILAFTEGLSNVRPPQSLDAGEQVSETACVLPVAGHTAISLRPHSGQCCISEYELGR